MVAPERVIPDSLVVARDRMLPKLPELRAAIFCKEGFDLKRNKALVEAFVAARTAVLCHPEMGGAPGLTKPRAA